MESKILSLLKGDPSDKSDRKASNLKLRHDVASNRKDFPLKDVKDVKIKKDKPIVPAKRLQKLLES